MTEPTWSFRRADNREFELERTEDDPTCLVCGKGRLRVRVRTETSVIRMCERCGYDQVERNRIGT